jgi:hypothetical protein
MGSEAGRLELDCRRFRTPVKTSRERYTQYVLSGYVCAIRQGAGRQHSAPHCKHARPTSLKSLLSTLDQCHETDLPHRPTCHRLLVFHDEYSFDATIHLTSSK